ncbi:cytochrome P450 [Xylariales sp. PMI_506]|nr:cytochrome P450 [Xylariales sp. PMI_506]
MITSIAIACLGLFSCFLLVCIYNLTLHPLARFPGPLIYRATRWGTIVRLIQGRQPYDLLELHKKYGDIVRIAPDELAFSHADAWQDIYGHRPQGSTGPPELPKWPTFYRNASLPPSLLNESRENHALLRRLLAPGFSERAMRDQEPLIGGYIDLLIQQLHKHCAAQPAEAAELADGEGTEKPQVKVGEREPVDMTSWYTWTTFDVIGDLAFGEPFGCLARGVSDQFVKQLDSTGKMSGYMWAMKYTGLDILLAPLIRFLLLSRRASSQETSAKLERRIALKEERPDLIGGLLKKKEAWNLDFLHIRMNAGLLVIAGSETTATLLTGVTYHLLKNPEILKQLTQEVRSSFKSEDEITLISVSRLNYMLACLNEGLRSYPPVPFAFPRQVPKGGATIAGEFIPEGTVCGVWQWAVYHSEKLFNKPFEFHPERFLGDPEFADDKLDMLQPFSVGPRNCIGRNLAYAEMRLILARIIYNFDMELVDGKEDWLDQEIYFFWKKPPLRVFLRPVKGSN